LSPKIFDSDNRIFRTNENLLHTVSRSLPPIRKSLFLIGCIFILVSGLFGLIIRIRHAYNYWCWGTFWTSMNSWKQAVMRGASALKPQAPTRALWFEVGNKTVSSVFHELNKIQTDDNIGKQLEQHRYYEKPYQRRNRKKNEAEVRRTNRQLGTIISSIIKSKGDKAREKELWAIEKAKREAHFE
jgi:ribosomal protein S21